MTRRDVRKDSRRKRHETFTYVFAMPIGLAVLRMTHPECTDTRRCPSDGRV